MSAAAPTLSPATLASLLETISDAVFALDSQWRFTYANQTASRLARFPREELIGAVIWDLYPDLGSTSFNTALTRAMVDRETVRFELHYEPFDITVEATAYPTAEGITVIARDVTGQRGEDRLRLDAAAPQAKLALGGAERSGQLYRTLAAAMPQIVWFTDAAGRTRYLNERWYDYTGASPDEATKAPFTFMHPDDREGVTPLWNESIALGTPFETEFRLRERDGSYRWFLTRAVPGFGANGEILHWIGTSTDIDERKLTQERSPEADRLARRLEQAQRIESLGRVATTMAHEINNVLMGIQPMADFIERTATDPVMLSAAAQIARAMQRGKRVTEQILRFTRPTPPLLAPVELGSLVSRLASETAAMADSEIEYSITVPGVPVRVRGDAAQLEQVLRNVLFNARDAMPDGGTLDITLRTAGPNPPVDLGDGRWAQVAVSDTGHGMEADTLLRIFEPFFTTRGDAGTGLGLAVAHQIVTAHGGVLHAASRSGEGTILSFFLPVLEGEPIPATAPEIAGEAREVLLIEDDADVAEGLKMLLELEGKEVRVAPTAAEGLAMLRERMPSVVVLDVGLPDMEGTLLFERIREIAPELPIIFSTGHSDAGRLARQRTEPKVGSLLKPYGIDELLKAIQQVV